MQKQKSSLIFIEVHTLNPKGLFFLYTNDSLPLVCLYSITYEAVYQKTPIQALKQEMNEEVWIKDKWRKKSGDKNGHC